jgi:putative endonuclease
MMYSVYAIYSARYNKIYIGYTSNLVKRLDAHNSYNNTGWTTKFKPWIVLFTEECDSKQNARIREIQLKSSQGRKLIRSLITNS